MEESHVFFCQQVFHRDDPCPGHIAVIVDSPQAAADAGTIIPGADAAAAVHHQGQACLFGNGLHPVKIQHGFGPVNTVGCAKGRRQGVDAGVFAEGGGFIRAGEQPRHYACQQGGAYRSRVCRFPARHDGPCGFDLNIPRAFCTAFADGHAAKHDRLGRIADIALPDESCHSRRFLDS